MRALFARRQSDTELLGELALLRLREERVRAQRDIAIKALVEIGRRLEEDGQGAPDPSPEFLIAATAMEKLES